MASDDNTNNWDSLSLKVDSCINLVVIFITTENKEKSKFCLLNASIFSERNSMKERIPYCLIKTGNYTYSLL